VTTFVHTRQLGPICTASLQCSNSQLGGTFNTQQSCSLTTLCNRGSATEQHRDCGTTQSQAGTGRQPGIVHLAAASPQQDGAQRIASLRLTQ
jgi:hypothetical protein